MLLDGGGGFNLGTASRNRGNHLVSPVEDQLAEESYFIPAHQLSKVGNKLLADGCMEAKQNDL